MSHEGAEHALMRLRADRHRIVTALLDLEDRRGYRLLSRAKLRGRTRRRWEEARARIAALWAMSDAFGRVLDRAERFRNRHTSPSRADLEELTWLLTGPSVEPAGEEPGLERHTVLGPAGERLTLDEALARMSEDYTEVADTVASADAAWSALLPRLDEIEGAWRRARDLLRTLRSEDPDLAGIGARLTEVRKAVLADPLSLATQGRTDTAPLDLLAGDLARRHGALEAAVRIQGEYEERVAGADASIERVRRLEREALRAREHVLRRITVSAVPEIPRLTSALGDQRTALTELRDAGRWADLAARMADLERATADALRRTGDALRDVTEPLERRRELRGRLETYRAEAARLRHAEDPRLADLQRQAHELLWQAPCDLRRAAAAVASYERAVGSLRGPEDHRSDR
jgi:hypothetical protein